MIAFACRALVVLALAGASAARADGADGARSHLRQGAP